MNLHQLHEQFPSDDACLKKIMQMRRIRCCPGKKLSRIQGRKTYACVCGKQFSPLAGTIFEKSRTPLRDWFYALFLITSTRSGVSAGQLQRELGCTNKTAWRMFKQIRSVMKENDKKLKGTVEVDESYIGGRRRGSFSPNSNPKDVLFGMVERGGKTRLVHVPDNGRSTLFTQLTKHVQKGSLIHSDEYNAYTPLSSRGYFHETVKHKDHEYARGSVTTNNIENVWSHLKRGTKGVYRVVSKKHLQSYADEYAFRYNHRHEQDEMFEILLKRAVTSSSSSCVSLG